MSSTRDGVYIYFVFFWINKADKTWTYLWRLRDATFGLWLRHFRHRRFKSHIVFLHIFENGLLMTPLILKIDSDSLSETFIIMTGLLIYKKTFYLSIWQCIWNYFGCWCFLQVSFFISIADCITVESVYIRKIKLTF